MARTRAVCGGFPRAERRALALPESKVLSTALEAGELRLVLSAVILVSAGTPGVDAGTSWSQEVELRISGASLERALAGPLWISAGALLLGDERLELLMLPFEKQGPLRLELRGDEGELVAAGTGLALTLRGAPVFLERFEGQPTQ